MKNSIELTKDEIRLVRNFLELKACELEETKHPKAKEVDRLAKVFDDALYECIREINHD